jgi:hypothetical protein
MLNPQIPLSVDPPAKIQSPLDSMVKVQTLKALTLEQEQRQLDLQAKVQAAQDDAAVRAAFQMHGEDMDAILDTLSRTSKGGYMSVRKFLTEQQAAQAKTATEQYKLFQTRLDTAARILQGVNDEGSFQAALPAVTSVIGPELASQLGTNYDPGRIEQALNWGLEANQYATKMHQGAQLALDAMKAGPDSESKWRESIATTFSATKSDEQWQQLLQMYRAVAPGNPMLKQLLSTIPAGYSPEAAQQIALMGVSPEKRTEEARLAVSQAEAMRHNRATEAISAGQLGVAKARLGLDAQMYQVGAVGADVGLGEEALKGLSPQEANLIKKIANYQIALPVGIATSREPWVTRLTRAAAYDPTFDQTQYQARQRLRISFQSQGKPADNIRSLNTAVGHLATLKQKAEALQNAPVTVWNTVKNYGLGQTGDKRIVEFNSAATAVADELATLFKGTAGTDEQIKAWRATLNSSMSPEQLRGAIDTAIELTGSRLEALTNQYEVGMGKPKDFRILYPKSQQILKSLGIDANKLDPVASPNKQTSPPPAGGAPGTPTLRFNPQTGKVEPVGGQTATAPTQAPTPAAGGVPPAVAAVLQGATPGRHTLSDGSVWQKDQNGRITRIK